MDMCKNPSTYMDYDFINIILYGSWIFFSLSVSDKSEELINLNINHNHGEFIFFSGRSKFAILKCHF